MAADPRRLARSLAAALAAALVVSSSCGDGARLVLPNVPPTLELDPLAVVIRDGQRVYRAKWRGADADGRIATYRFALDPVDPSTPDDGWQATREQEHLIFIPPQWGDGAHVFAVVAEDDRGARSATAAVGFTRRNVAPTVELTSPNPGNETQSPVLWASTGRIEWRGFDPDGGEVTHPVSYRYRCFPEGTAEYALGAADPDSIRALHAPGFFGWEVADGAATEGAIAIAPGVRYLVAVTGFDVYGDFDPVFSPTKNLAWITGAVPDPPSLSVRVGNDVAFFHSRRPWPAGSDSVPPRLELPPRGAIAFRWSATAFFGAGPVTYRWALLPSPFAAPADTAWHDGNGGLDTPPGVTLAAEALFPSARLVVEARDAAGGVSTVVIQLEIVMPTFHAPLLVVMDTRLPVDARRFGASCVDPPAGPWPTSSELDTLLFARGGVRWRCREPNLLSAPGIFAGYAFDTIGTRALGTRGIPLTTLMSYRHVVWIVDPGAAVASGPIGDPVNPRALLRHLSSMLTDNVLRRYAELGGNVWLLGGGAGDASTLAWNRTSNDDPTRRYASDGTPPELMPGTLMYDQSAWRSSFRLAPALLATLAPGRRAGDPSLAGLPEVLRLRTATSDPMPGRASEYPTRYRAEFLELPNPILRDGESELDTLYAAVLEDPPPNAPPLPVMTIHRSGVGGATFVFSGFDLWSFRREHAVAVVDHVLQRVWNLRRDPAAATAGGP